MNRPSRERFKRLQQQRLAAIQREKSDPNGVALRVLPRLVFGEGHPYAAPLSGNGDEAGVAALTRDDLQRFYARWFRPEQTTLTVAGAVTLEELLPILERRFESGGRCLKIAAPCRLRLDASSHVAKRTSILYVIDRPDAAQSVIVAGCPAAAKREADEAAIQVMNTFGRLLHEPYQHEPARG